MLAGGAAGAAALALAACRPGSGGGGDGGAAAPSTPGTGGPGPASGEAVDRDTDALVLHTARRLTFGPTPDVVADVRRLGPAAWIDAQLDWRSIDDGEAEAHLAAFPLATGSPDAIEGDPHPLKVRDDLASAAVVRAVWGQRQLYELLCDLWTNHFNVDVGHKQAAPFLPSADQQVVRANATGRFADMLLASAQSPAMLVYLDQAASRADGGRLPNENYARELLELHTVGVDGGYDEGDVKEVAHLLSGWTLADKKGGFRFRPAWHDMGDLATGGDVLGWRPEGLRGQAAGEAFLAFLARHPATATRLAHKVAVRFVGEHVATDDPVVGDAARAYLDADTAIAPMVRSVLTSDAFASAPPRFRRPLELVAACLRGAGVAFDPKVVGRARQDLELLGQTPYAWPTPDGFPDADAAWLSAGGLVTRWNVAATTAGLAPAGRGGPDARRILADASPSTAGAAVDAMATAVHGAPFAGPVRDATLAALGLGAATAWDRRSDAATLLALVLQGPDNQLR